MVCEFSMKIHTEDHGRKPVGIYLDFVFILVGHCLFSFDFLLAYGCLLLGAPCGVNQANGLLNNLAYIS